MFVTLSIEEINEFPAEVRKFLCDYISKNLPLDSEASSDGAYKDQRIPPPDFSDQLKTSTDQFEELPFIETRYNRELVSANFNWELMMETELGTMWQEGLNQIYIKVNGDHFELDLAHAQYVETNKPSTWGFIIILGALFGFGGCVPGFKPARNPKELAKNLEKLGISGGAPVEPRSIGPLLKSVTKIFDLWHGKFLDGPPVHNLHWFDFDKRGNFYFAGTTFDDCYEAVKNVTQERFIVTGGSSGS